MKKNCLLLLTVILLVGSTYAQQSKVKQKSTTELEMEKFLKEDTEPMFKNTIVPDSFKDESIVILARKIKLKFYGKGNLSSQYAYIHTKMLLNDISAIEKFSEFTFDEPSNFSALELNVIKKGGEIIPVDLKDAIQEGFEFKFKGSLTGFSLGDKQSKIAIKNLEVGDIIEYVGMVDKWSTNYKSTYFMAGSYPVLGCKIIYEFPTSGFVFAHKSINGAPEFKKGAKKNALTYTLVDDNRPKYEEELENLEKLTQPYIKVQVIADHLLAKQDFIYKKGKVKTKITDEDLKATVYKTIKNLGGMNELYMDYIEKYGYSQTEKEYLTQYWYFLREYEYAWSVAFNGETPSYGIYLMESLIKAARKRKIDYDIILFRDIEDGPFENLLFESELYWGVVFKTTEGDLGFYSFNMFANPEEYPLDFLGTTAYRVTPGSSIAKTKLEKFNVPASNATEHQLVSSFNVSFLNGFDSLLINHSNKQTGYYKLQTRYKLLNQYTYFEKFKQHLKDLKIVKDDKYRYYFVRNAFYKEFDEKFMKSEEERNLSEFKKNQHENIKNYLASRHEDEGYELYKFIDYKVTNDGSAPGKSWVEWDENFIIGGVTSKSSDKYLIVEIGKVLGEMYEINNDRNREIRNNDFFITTNRSVISKIKFTIPSGYKIGDITSLNQTFSNKTGSFTATATVENDQLIITYDKTYNANKYQSSDWPEFIKFLDVSASFTRNKIVLEKK